MTENDPPLQQLVPLRMEHVPPEQIATPRLVLRLTRSGEAHLLRAAIDMSLDHLRAWLPWAMKEPRSLAETTEQLEHGAARFRAGEDYQYSIFSADEGEILGGIGLNPRPEQDCLEIGYWVRVDRVGQGIATEAVQAIATLHLAGTRRRRSSCSEAR